MKNKGFTLIELLVVIAIIGILSTVVINSISSAKIRAKDVTVRSRINDLRNIFTMCDHGDTKIIPPTANLDVPNVPNGGGNICQNADISDVVWPDLSIYGWWYYKIEDNVAGDNILEVSITKSANVGGEAVVCNIDGCIDTVR